MRRLFEGGVTNAETLAAGGDYSRAATIRGRRLIDEIRYIRTNFEGPQEFVLKGFHCTVRHTTSQYKYQDRLHKV